MGIQKGKAAFLLVPLFIVWYVLVLLDRAGTVHLGDNPVDVAWLIYSMLWLTVFFVARRFIVRRHLMVIPLLVLLAQTIVFHLAHMRGWYAASPLVNRAEHFFGTIIVLMLVDLLMVGRPSFEKMERRYRAIIIGGLALGITVLNEIIEMTMDLITRSSHVGPDVLDTSWDLAMNSMAIVLYLIVRYSFGGSDRTISSG